MKKLFYFLFIFIFLNLAAKAQQQDPQFSFNKETQLLVNPGFAGSNDALTGLILNRYQWSGFDGAPQTLLFSVETTANIFGRSSGVGLNIISDQLGFAKNVLVNLNYSYHIPTSIGELGIGTSLGLYYVNINGEWETYVDGSFEPGSGEGDFLIPKGEVSQATPDVGLGVYLKSPDYFASLSVTHLNQGEITYNQAEKEATTFLPRQFYLAGGYNISLTNPLFELQPAIFAKTDLSSAQVDLTLNVVYNERFTGGLSYRIQDAVALLVGVELLNGLNVGLAYDITTSAMGRNGYGSQEIYLRYTLGLGKGRMKKYKSIRFL